MWDLVTAGKVALTLIVGLVSVVAGRALSCRRRRYRFSSADLSDADLEPASLRGSEDRLAQGLRIPTVSTSRDDPPPREQLLRYHQHLRDSFPTVFSSHAVTVEVVNELSLLLTVAGSEPQLSPYLLLSHMDVVPVVEEHWSWPPFDGLVQDGYIIGRGAIDVKQTTHAILESLERRLLAGDLPRRPLIVALGHDEEVSGREGAARIGHLLEQRGARPLFVLDEGITLMQGFFPGVRQPLAVVGVSEKGYLALEVTARGQAGHSSIPPVPTAVGRLARAVNRLHADPQPVLFGRGPEMELLRVMGPVASPPFRLVYANLWLFGAVLKRAFLKNPALRASVQTTTAVTVLRGGYKENVVPAHASAIINHRISPLQDRDDVMACDRNAISDPEMEFEVLHHSPASPISPYGEDDAPFGLLAGTVRQLYGDDVLTAPAVMVANTDTRHYLHLTDNVYRFNPIVLRPDQLGMFHGNDERISVENYHNCIRFYYRLMKNMESDAVVAQMP
ncbi:N-fatty-acyl-amino acid synthase/hydrolase PM20D1-like [Pollicipes pollicipes]|uniref:N-fatty-acyl-amino acid synthase/hydrolase PM20D1-like n=1 Tax=Pollicipes pollicipes TaxID=41117 RepID=UPI001884A515|nr:N-fatty-acyl-amino acid synthase/hydrolase PM20D1-like [Pollicipes pollicipes]